MNRPDIAASRVDSRHGPAFHDSAGEELEEPRDGGGEPEVREARSAGDREGRRAHAVGGPARAGRSASGPASDRARGGGVRRGIPLGGKNLSLRRRDERAAGGARGGGAAADVRDRSE